MTRRSKYFTRRVYAMPTKTSNGRVGIIWKQSNLALDMIELAELVHDLNRVLAKMEDAKLGRRS